MSQSDRPPSANLSGSGPGFRIAGVFIDVGELLEGEPLGPFLLLGGLLWRQDRVDGLLLLADYHQSDQGHLVGDLEDGLHQSRG